MYTVSVEVKEEPLNHLMIHFECDHLATEFLIDKAMYVSHKLALDGPTAAEIHNTRELFLNLAVDEVHSWSRFREDERFVWVVLNE